MPRTPSPRTGQYAASNIAFLRQLDHKTVACCRKYAGVNSGQCAEPNLGDLSGVAPRRSTENGRYASLGAPAGPV